MAAPGGAGDSRVIKVGNTSYLSVRKGDALYRIADGRTVTDAAFVWQVKKDPTTKKTFYVNGLGTRRWHLPDLALTDEEAIRIEQVLRQAKARKEVGERTETQVPQPLIRDFHTRELKSLTLEKRPSWESDGDKQGEVLKAAKSALLPFYSSNEIDKKMYVSLVSVASREYMAEHDAPLTDADREHFREHVISMAESMLDDMDRVEDTKRMNDDLTKRNTELEDLCRNLEVKTQQCLENEEKLKEEIFELRGDKRNVILQSFKRLTKNGLVKAYWERWIAAKESLDEQIKQNRRNRRIQGLVERGEKLQGRVMELTQQNQKLLERVGRAEGRDVVKAMQKSIHTALLRNCFVPWQDFARERRIDRRFHELQKLVDNCPSCQHKEIHEDRLRRRHDEAQAEITEKATRIEYLEKQVGNNDSEIKARDGEIGDLRREIHALEKEIGRLRARVGELEHALGDATREVHNLEESREILRFDNEMLVEKVSAGERQDRRGSLASHARADTSGGANGKSVLGGDMDGSSGLVKFFSAEAVSSSGKLRKFYARREELESEKAAAYSGAHGALQPLTAEALAPGIQHADHLSPDRTYRPSRAAGGDDARSSDDDISVDSPPSGAAPTHVSQRTPSENRAPETAQKSKNGETERDPLSRCQLCGFRMSTTPFCPKDGHRHQFVSLVSPSQSRDRGTERKAREVAGGELTPEKQQGAALNFAGAYYTATAKQSQGSDQYRTSRPTAGYTAMGGGSASGNARSRNPMGLVTEDHARHAREVAAQINATRAMVDARPGLRAERTPYAHVTKGTSVANQGDRSPGYNAVFDTRDVSMGAYGLPTQQADKVFGVRKTDKIDQQRHTGPHSPQYQRTAPNFVSYQQ